MSARLDREDNPPGPIVSGFAAGGFRVGDEIHRDGLLLTPEWARGWAAPAIEAIDVATLAPLLDLDPPPEFLLLGTGAALVRPPRTLVEAIETRGSGVEPMDSRAAARAWGVLRGEGRWIAAALLPLTS